jgi:hypothetical protein
MSKIAYLDTIGISGKNAVKLNNINAIIEEYAADGYTLTLRQLYYQLVSRDMIPNRDSEYSKLSSLLSKGRMAGWVDWNAIEDRTRRPIIPYSCDGIADALDDIASQYRLDRMRDQDEYIEVWVEKDALSGVLRRITEKYHIRLMVNRGYSSTTAMHDAALRMSDNSSCTILYLGDHDPSGLDMVRDIKSRFEDFDEEVDVIPIALTSEQISEFSPPPNPAKVTDPRASDYIAEYGAVSWEVDALNPRVLLSILESAIRERIDIDVWNDTVRLEQRHRERLRELKQQMLEEDW